MKKMEAIKEESSSYLSFKIGTELFAAHVAHVNNIIEVPKITEVPQTPEYMVGVMNLRGIALPVIDTRIKFGMTPTIVTSNTCVLVLEICVDDQTILIGAMVDEVNEVLEIDKHVIRPVPSIESKYADDFIQGMVQQKDAFIMILDIHEVFSTKEIVELQKANLEKIETDKAD